MQLKTSILVFARPKIYGVKNDEIEAKLLPLFEVALPTFTVGKATSLGKSGGDDSFLANESTALTFLFLFVSRQKEK